MRFGWILTNFQAKNTRTIDGSSVFSLWKSRITDLDYTFKCSGIWARHVSWIHGKIVFLTICIKSLQSTNFVSVCVDAEFFLINSLLQRLCWADKGNCRQSQGRKVEESKHSKNLQTKVRIVHLTNDRSEKRIRTSERASLVFVVRSSSLIPFISPAASSGGLYIRISPDHPLKVFVSMLSHNIEFRHLHRSYVPGPLVWVHIVSWGCRPRILAFPFHPRLVKYLEWFVDPRWVSVRRTLHSPDLDNEHL